jgi:uroporphyrinogen III methyltransferase/synthase
MNTPTERHILRVISRNSPLALLQVKELFALFPDLRYEVQEVTSYGDRHKDVSLMSGIAGDFFTRELDEAIRLGTADIAVHSAKDLPYPLPAGQTVYCLTQAADKSDSLVSKDNKTLMELPAGSRIGTSSKMRRQELLQLREDIEVVSIRGTIEERIAQVDHGQIDALIVATCALQRLGLAHRSAERLPFATHPLQGNLAVTGRADRPELAALFAAHDIRRTYGTVTLVGFGPGDPGLLTLAGDEALRQADVIFHDDLLDSQFLQRYQGEKVYVGKRNGCHSHSQDAINELLYQAALAGRQVVRLKGGDPMVFAHGREEIDYLKSRMVEVKVIPGVSTGIAVAATAQLPLTHRGLSSSVAFVSGHGKQVEAPDADTLLYYMGGTNLSVIAQALLTKGRTKETPVALVYNVSRADERCFFLTLGELRHALLKGLTPVVVMIGETVALGRGEHLQRVLVTGTKALPPAVGEEITHTPLIRMEAAPAALPAPAAYDGVVFTSRHGVRYFMEALAQAGIRPSEALTGKYIASVGPVTTQALAAYGLHPDYESPTESAAGLLAHFQSIPPRTLLLPRSDHKLLALSEGLQAQGHTVRDLTVYRNLPNEQAETVDLTKYQKVVFSSPTGVEAFRQKYHGFPDGLLYVAKGDTTSQYLNDLQNEKI